MEELIKKAIYKRLILESGYEGQALDFFAQLENGAFIYMINELNLMCTYYDSEVKITKV